VQPGRLQLGLCSGVATQPFVAGTAPGFGDLQLGATNASELDMVPFALAGLN
jgi:hypothetical protein